MSQKGILITFEGGDGTGKTTQIGILQQRLKDQDIPCMVTREPGGTSLGELIRPFFLTHSLDAEVELLLMLAVRRHHICTVIQPALDRGEWVLCDRFIDSSVVYQGTLKGRATTWVKEWHEKAGIDLRPDLTFIFQDSSEVALERRRNDAKEGANRFDDLPIHSYEQIRQAFLDIALSDPERCMLVPSGSIEDIAHYIEHTVKKYIT
jgi:dTMP kinase